MNPSRLCLNEIIKNWSYLLLVALLLFVYSNCKSQTVNLKDLNYSVADSTAIHFPKKKYKNVSEIALPLTEKLKSDAEKFRAIFRWITENIEYNKSASGSAEAEKVVRKNKAVCQGFSNLLKEMCDAVLIPCEVITGFTKTDYKDIDKKLKKSDHAWNSVELGGKKYLVDVTWATSKYNVVARKFVKEFDEHYYLTPPEKFILDHYPEKKEQQLLEKTCSQKKFIRSPLLYPDYFHLSIEHLTPNDGKFKWKKNKSLRFEFLTDTKIESISTLSNYDTYVCPAEIKTEETASRPQKKYVFEKVFEKPGKHIFTMYANGNCIAEYFIEVK